jgi:hypothetical protein
LLEIAASGIRGKGQPFIFDFLPEDFNQVQFRPIGRQRVDKHAHLSQCEQNAVLARVEAKATSAIRTWPFDGMEAGVVTFERKPGTLRHLDLKLEISACPGGLPSMGHEYPHNPHE